MTYEDKIKMFKDAEVRLKEWGFRVFRVYSTHPKMSEKRIGWLLFSNNDLTCGTLSLDMHCYRISSNHEPCKAAGCGISTIDWGTVWYGQADRLKPYCHEAMQYPCPAYFMRRSSLAAKSIIPLSLSQKLEEYDNLGWAYEEV